MRSEVLRLQSFKDDRHLNNVKVSVILLAREGYYLDHNTGKILCFSCSYEYSNQISSTLHEIVHVPGCQRHKFNKSFRKGTSFLTPDVLEDQVASGQQNNEQGIANAGDVHERLTPTNGSVHNLVNGHSNQELLNNEQQQNRAITQHPQNEDRHRQSPSTTDRRRQSPSTTDRRRQSPSTTDRRRQSPSTTDRRRQSPSTTTPKTTTFSQAQAGTARESASEHSTLNISSVSHPHFSTRQARIDTFTGWNPAHSHRPDDFADLGFFYTGEADLVRCFCCGIGFKYWRPTDDIAYQHARQRPTCAFNRLCKGQEYIDKVQQEVQSQQDELDRHHLGLSVASTPPSGATSTGANLPGPNTSLRGYQSATADRQTNPAATTDRQSSSAYTTNGQTSSAYTTNGQASSEYTTNGQASSEYTTNGQISAAVSTNIQTNPSVIAHATASPGVSANGLVMSCDTTFGRNSSLDSSSSTDSIDSLNSEDSGIAPVSRASEISTLESATNDDFSNFHQATALRDQPTRSAEPSKNQELRVVEREHSLLSERTTCRVCRTSDVNCIFLPCGHVATCQACADKVTHCVLCNRAIIGTANVYLA
ncbi:hypothetical protein BsWGS_12542 [Bradybaena similaris]